MKEKAVSISLFSIEEMGVLEMLTVMRNHIFIL
jgi:hypothetical protein